MPTIDIQQQQYKTYVLTDETEKSQVEIVPERGGIITRWRVQGQEIFYLDTERFTDPNLSVRGGVPILFPICGNLPENKFTHQGKEYTLKQHGFARDLPWSASGDVATQSEARLNVTLKSTEQTLAVYPFPFQVTYTYVLKGSSLEIRQEYKNLGSEPMPFSYGFHPYFAVTDKSQLQFEIPGQEYMSKAGEVEAYAGHFDLTQDEIDIAFKQLSRKSATVTDNASHGKLQLNWDETFSTLVFWAVKGKDFYCLEPWSAPRNALNTGEHLTVLAPHSSTSATMTMTVNL